LRSFLLYVFNFRQYNGLGFEMWVLSSWCGLIYK
jgi:hypothetical protein